LEKNLEKMMREIRDRFINQLNLFGNISINLGTMKKGKINLLKSFNDVTNIFIGFENKFGFSIKNDISKDITVGPMYEAELYSIFINTLSNAVKAVIAGKGKTILVTANDFNNYVLLRIYDDGIGMDESTRNSLFQPFRSDPENKLYKELSKRLNPSDYVNIGEGSGLGLFILKEITNSYGQYAKFIDVDAPWKTCIEVGLPK
jgi:signal transduction histidine kinase